MNALTHLTHTEFDYLVNRQNRLSRIFTVTFQSKQANSTENDIVFADDAIVEGIETFRLRIVAARFIGQAETIFRAQDGLNKTIANVAIEDDDCKFMNTPRIICLQTVTKSTYAYILVMHALSLPTVVEVSWIISEPFEFLKREGMRLELFAQAFGVYATPIEVGVVCAGGDVTDVPPGADTISSSATLEHAIIYHSSPICLQPSWAETLLS